jgi:2-polyprenyl-6-hydroxyphenyl methylase/3-demethylubiquinone-9 3-methyltransferase
VVSFDYDADSVACTAALRDRFRPDDPDWRVERGSILDDGYLAGLGTFDVVYSWGVLHHTGAMDEAVRKAASLVVPGGLLVIALYRKTRLCPLWKAEKRWFNGASPAAQQRARTLYVAGMRAAYRVAGRDFAAHVASYSSMRGMSFWHDVHDWMGGYPYESITPAEVDALVSGLGFTHVKSWTRGYTTGILGSGCDEYTYRRLGA